MEKIYEEKNNTKKKKKGKYDVSVILSFVVAIVAVISLIVVGFNQISYSADTPDLGESFTFTSTVHTDQSPIRISGSGDGASFITFMYETDNGIPIFCIQKNVNPGVNQEYVLGGKEDNDFGLLYILNRSGIYGGSGIIDRSSVPQDSYKYYEYFATQVALWTWLSNNNPGDSKHTFNTEELKKLNSFSVFTSSTSDVVPALDNFNMYERYIGPVLAGAEKAQATKNAKSFEVNFKDKSVFTDAGDYYQTSAVNVSADPFEDLSGYTVSVGGIDGAIIVDGDGNELKGEIKNSVFYVRIPKDKITDKTTQIIVSANARFDNYLEGYEYVASDDPENTQKVITVKNVPNIISAPATIDISASPDTAIFKDKTILYTSVILLLFGISLMSATVLFYRRSKLRKSN